MGIRNTSGRNSLVLAGAMSAMLRDSQVPGLAVPTVPPVSKPLIDPAEKAAEEKKMVDDFIAIASCRYPVTVSSATYDERKAGRRSAESGWLHRVKPAADTEQSWKPSKKWKKKHGIK